MANKKYMYLTEQLKSMGIQFTELQNLVLNCKDTKRAYQNRDYMAMLRQLDITQWTSRYVWKGLPNYLDSYLIELMLYYKSSLVGFFYGGKLYIMPYAQTGKLDILSRPTSVNPIAYNENKFFNLELHNYNSYTTNKPNCVILYETTPLWNSTKSIPRLTLHDTILEDMEEVLRKGRINLRNAVKKIFNEVESQEQVSKTNRQIEDKLDDDSPVITVVKNDITGNNHSVYNADINLETEKIMQYFSSLNNLRCYVSGIKNNGVFEKMERVVTGELTGNELQSNLILENGLLMRRNFIDDLKEVYPQYKDILDKISVDINEDAYKSHMDDDIENATRAEEKGTTSQGGIDNE